VYAKISPRVRGLGREGALQFNFFHRSRVVQRTMTKYDDFPYMQIAQFPGIGVL
jgi:hypothetical protein